MTVPDNATTSLSATATDALNGVSLCSSVTSYTADSVAPSAPSSLATNPASPANDNDPRITGTAEAGSTVNVYATNDCTGGSVASGTAATFGEPPGSTPRRRGQLLDLVHGASNGRGGQSVRLLERGRLRRGLDQPVVDGHLPDVRRRLRQRLLEHRDRRGRDLPLLGRHLRLRRLGGHRRHGVRRRRARQGRGLDQARVRQPVLERHRLRRRHRELAPRDRNRLVVARLPDRQLPRRRRLRRSRPRDRHCCEPGDAELVLADLRHRGAQHDDHRAAEQPDQRDRRLASPSARAKAARRSSASSTAAAGRPAPRPRATRA